MTAALVEIVCQACSEVFVGASPWGDWYCSARCRAAHHIRRRLSDRERNRRWCATHRKSTGAQPWLAGPPPYDTHLPVVSCAITVDPIPQWPIELRNTRGLHGALTTLLDEGHGPRHPRFGLRPWMSGWAAHWWTDSGASLAGRSLNGALFDRPTTFTFGPAVRWRAPVVLRRGRQRVRLETLTPVVQRSDGGARPCVRPSSPSMQSTLVGEWLQRFGLEYLAERDLIRVEVGRVETQPVRVDLGGKYGAVACWEGTVHLEVNAPARWLLEAAARVGFGSRTAFGFGCVRVSEVP